MFLSLGKTKETQGELEKAVEDGYLVDYRTIETKMKFLEEGIRYDDLSEEEKERGNF